MCILHETLERAVELIVAAAEPVKIILFGSAARGDMGEHSDLDMLVVIRPGQHRRQTAQKIYRNLVGLGFAVDLVVVTTADLKHFKNEPGMIIATALKEGRELYAA